jgi:ATP-dependent DNA ligase
LSEERPFQDLTAGVLDASQVASSKPALAVIPRVEFKLLMADGLRFDTDPAYIAQEKIDGVRCLLEWGHGRGRARKYKLPGELPEIFNDAVLDGELKDGLYYVFDVVVWQGREVSRLPLSDRLAILDTIPLASWMRPVRRSMHVAGFLAQILNEGGEGVVIKPLRGTWGYGWTKCKKSHTEDCVIASINNATGVASLVQYAAGKTIDCGKVSILRDFDYLSAGMVVEVEVFDRHDSGKFREARYLRWRDDKPAVDCLVRV